MSKLVEVGPVIYVKKSVQAKLFRIDSLSFWIPDSQLDDYEVKGHDSDGNEIWMLIIPEWLAIDKELDDYVTDTTVF
jgi:hypothetical protein